MSFRVKLRIKSVNPYSAKPHGSQVAFIPQIQTDPDLLRALYEAGARAMKERQQNYPRWWQPQPNCNYAAPAGDFYIRN